MPSRSPTICSVTPASREAEAQPPKSRSRDRSRPAIASIACSERRGDLEGVGEAAGRAVEGDEFERHLLRHPHHELLQLGLGPEADQPHLAPWGLAARCAAS